MNMKYGKELESGNRAYEAPDVGLSGVDALVSDARCPLCGDKVFIPNKALRDALGGDNALNDPQVWCVDHGHWVGFLSQCAH